jgi:hypothetical protein
VPSRVGEHLVLALGLDFDHVFVAMADETCENVALPDHIGEDV